MSFPRHPRAATPDDLPPDARAAYEKLKAINPEAAELSLRAWEMNDRRDRALRGAKDAESDRERCRRLRQEEEFIEKAASGGYGPEVANQVRKVRGTPGGHGKAMDIIRRHKRARRNNQ